MQAIRASSLGDLLDCPARWEAKYVKGMFLPTSPSAQLGTSVHTGAALFDQAFIEGKDPKPEEFVDAVVKEMQFPRYDVDWGDENRNELTQIAIATYKMYCEKVARNQHYIAVEATCPDLEITDLDIKLTGTTDRVYLDPLTGKLGIADLKTGKTAVGADGTVKTIGHTAQVAVYEILANQALQKPIEAPAQIIGLQVAKTDKGRRVGIGTIENARNILLGDDDSDTPGVLEVAARLIKSGLFYGNPRSFLCSKEYCPNFGLCRWK